jgi:hypothetical protein
MCCGIFTSLLWIFDLFFGIHFLKRGEFASYLLALRITLFLSPLLFPLPLQPVVIVPLWADGGLIGMVLWERRRGGRDWPIFCWILAFLMRVMIIKQIYYEATFRSERGDGGGGAKN